LQARLRSVSATDRERFIDLLTEQEVVEIDDVPAVSRDPKDDKFLATAVAAGAHYIVSEDRDLLDLVEYQGVQIVDAAAFLSILQQEHEQQL
jgi:putative PIN family toxin of toxin-antitoxin system